MHRLLRTSLSLAVTVLLAACASTPPSSGLLSEGAPSGPLSARAESGEWNVLDLLSVSYDVLNCGEGVASREERGKAYALATYYEPKLSEALGAYSDPDKPTVEEVIEKTYRETPCTARDLSDMRWTLRGSPSWIEKRYQAAVEKGWIDASRLENDIAAAFDKYGGAPAVAAAPVAPGRYRRGDGLMLSNAEALAPYPEGLSWEYIEANLLYPHGPGGRYYGFSQPESWTTQRDRRVVLLAARVAGVSVREVAETLAQWDRRRRILTAVTEFERRRVERGYDVPAQTAELQSWLQPEFDAIRPTQIAPTYIQAYLSAYDFAATGFDMTASAHRRPHGYIKHPDTGTVVVSYTEGQVAPVWGRGGRRETHGYRLVMPPELAEQMVTEHDRQVEVISYDLLHRASFTPFDPTAGKVQGSGRLSGQFGAVAFEIRPHRHVGPVVRCLMTRQPGFYACEESKPQT